MLALGVFIPAVSAQTELRLATLEISLWPEFDRAGVLVLLDGTLPAGATLPATLTLRLPSEPFAVAEADSGGSLLNADFQTAADGDDVVVTITLQRSTFRVEYYDEALIVAGSARTYAFAWAAPAAVDAVTLRVQSPSGASALQLGPEFGPPAVGDYGLNYQAAAIGPRAAGEMIAATISYSKASSALTVDALGLAAQPNPEPAVATTPEADLTPWLLGLAGIALAAAAYLGVQAYRAPRAAANPKPTQHRTRRSSRKPTEAPPAAIAAPEPGRFCTQCGHSLERADRFCRRCGAPVKA